jgi:adiponectin receptor
MPNRYPGTKWVWAIGLLVGHISNVFVLFQVIDKLVFAFFFIGALLCLACSTLFHTLCCHSKHVSLLWSRLDYAGIALLIVGSIIPWLYYAFYCQFYPRWIYIGNVSVFGFLILCLISWEKFNNFEFRVFRAIIFVTFTLVSSMPVIHFLIINDYPESIKKGSQCEFLAASTTC